MRSDFYIDLTVCKIPLGGAARHYHPGEDPVIVRQRLALHYMSFVHLNQ